MTITEPSTFVTDLILSATSFGFAYALARESRREHQRSILLWAVALAAGAAAALAGAVYHGFLPAMPAGSAEILWKKTVFLAGVGSLTSLWGSLAATLTGRLRRPLVRLAWIKFAVYAAWMLEHDDFRYVVYDQLAAMTAILLLHVYALRVGREAGSLLIVAGVAVAVLAGILQQTGFDLHRHFNHNDLFHVVQLGANYLFYRGARLLRDRLPD